MLRRPGAFPQTIMPTLGLLLLQTRYGCGVTGCRP